MQNDHGDDGDGDTRAGQSPEDQETVLGEEFDDRADDMGFLSAQQRGCILCSAEGFEVYYQ